MPSNLSARLEHVGIATDDVEGVLAVLAALLGEDAYQVETVGTDDIRTHFVWGGTAKLELLEPMSDGSPVARHLDRRGRGLHHLAFEVDDVETMYERARRAGFDPIDPSPRPGADGKKIFFLHPRQTGRVLFEFCQSVRHALQPIDSPTLDGVRSIARSAGAASRRPLVWLARDRVNAESVADRLSPERAVWAVETDDTPDTDALLDALGLESAHLAVERPREAVRFEAPTRTRIHALVLLDPDHRASHVVDGSGVLVLLNADEAGLELASELRNRSPGLDIVTATRFETRADIIAGCCRRLD